MNDKVVKEGRDPRLKIERVEYFPDGFAVYGTLTKEQLEWLSERSRRPEPTWGNMVMVSTPRKS